MLCETSQVGVCAQLDEMITTVKNMSLTHEDRPWEGPGFLKANEKPLMAYFLKLLLRDTCPCPSIMPKENIFKEENPIFLP